MLMLLQVNDAGDLELQVNNGANTGQEQKPKKICVGIVVTALSHSSIEDCFWI